MRKIVGLMSPITKNISYFYSNDFDFDLGDVVIVESDSGIDAMIVKKAY